jgi:hypothetical protein
VGGVIEIMESFISAYPVENASKVKASDWQRYVAALIKVAGTDGLVASEKKAILAELEKRRMPASTFAAAKALSRLPFDELLGGKEAARLLGPFLIRDLALVSGSDGVISRRERGAIREAARAMGIRAPRVRKVLDSVRLYRKAEKAWGSAQG